MLRLRQHSHLFQHQRHLRLHRLHLHKIGEHQGQGHRWALHQRPALSVRLHRLEHLSLKWKGRERRALQQQERVIRRKMAIALTCTVMPVNIIQSTLPEEQDLLMVTGLAHTTSQLIQRLTQRLTQQPTLSISLIPVRRLIL